MVGNCFQPKQTKPSYPTSEQSIDVQKQRKMEDELSHLVSSHNTLCQILEVFDKNKTANEYFKQARDEVLTSGNTGLGVMVIVALEKMCEVIEEAEERKEGKIMDSLSICKAKDEECELLEDAITHSTLPRYKCISELVVQDYDGDGFALDTYTTIPVGSIWEVSDNKERIVGGLDTIHLDLVSDKKSHWLEILEETFIKYFRKVE